MKKSLIVAIAIAAAAFVAVSASASPPTQVASISNLHIAKSDLNTIGASNDTPSGQGMTSAGVGLKPAIVGSQPRLASTSRVGITPPEGFRRDFFIYMNNSATGDFANHRKLLRTHGGGSGGISYLLLDRGKLSGVNPISI